VRVEVDAFERVVEKSVGTLAVFEIDESIHFCEAAWMSTCAVGVMSSAVVK